MPLEPLAPFYYLEHFGAVLRSLRDRDGDLLTSTEADFIHQFFELPRQLQALVARVAARTKALLLRSSLNYPEIADLPHSLSQLITNGWLCADPIVTMPELFAALPMERLAIGFGLKSHRALSKASMLSQAQEMYPAPTALSCTHFLNHEPLYQFVHAAACRRLCAQYFGNHHQAWSQYLIADRGIRRYECVAFEPDSRPFQCREEIEFFHALQLCVKMLDAEARAATILPLLPTPPTSCGWLKARHQRVAYRLGQRLEREGDLNAALTLYRSIGSPDAVHRRHVVSRKVTGERRTLRMSGRAVPHFDLALSQASAQRIEQRVARELEQSEPGCEVQVVENRLFNALFGLLFWRALFAPVRGAFFHAFQSAPADLYDEQFCEQRRAVLDETLQTLANGSYERIMREAFTVKAGLSNPWIPWWWLRASTLDRALQCIPAAHLLAVFQWMLQDLRHHVTGFPDLIQYWPHEARYRLLEVKLGADRLQDNQRRFLQHAHNHGLPIHVCYVSAPCVSTSVKVPKGRGLRKSSPSLGIVTAMPNSNGVQGHLFLNPDRSEWST